MLTAQSAALLFEKDYMSPLCWHEDYQAIPDLWQSWLLYPGSFMQRLKKNGVTDSSISIVQQTWQAPLLDEKKQLTIIGREWALVREVLIKNNNNHWMFARTVFPRASLTGKERQLARLKNRSLGSVLFRHQQMQRSKFKFTQIMPETNLHNKIIKLTKRNFGILWARNSIFWLGEKKLLLTEIFFPDVLTL